MTTTSQPEKPAPDSGQGQPQQPDSSPNYDPPIQKPIPDVDQPEQPADNQPEGGYDAPEKPKPE